MKKFKIENKRRSFEIFETLPKIHKANILLRVRSKESRLLQLARFLAKHLQPYDDSTNFYVKNAGDVVELIKGVDVTPEN